MRKFLFIPCFFVTSLISSAQSATDYSSIKLEVKEDYTAEVDKAALQAASHILSTPINNKNLPRLEAAQFLLRWMTGTPAYSFTLGDRVPKIAKDDLILVYMAAMTKYALEHPAESREVKKVELNAIITLIAYCQQYEVKMSSQLKKMSQANEKGELEKYLGE